jgi:response regulator RpfG family c-di-GMP phosphodiesterase
MNLLNINRRDTSRSLQAELDEVRRQQRELVSKHEKLEQVIARLRRWQERRRQERRPWNEHPSVKLLREVLRLAEPESLNFGLQARKYIHLIAGNLALDKLWLYQSAALLMHSGNLFIPAPLLKRFRTGQPVTGEELDLINQMPVMGANLLMQIPGFEDAAEIILYQRKNFDGSGMPRNGLTRHEIPLGGRLLRIIGEIVALEVQGMPTFKALEKISKWPNLFDPTLVMTAAEVLATNAVAPSSDGQPVALVELRVGQMLLSDVETKDGILVVPAGIKITRLFLEKINNFAEFSGVKEPIFVREDTAA